ncbi:MAG: 1-(5-phosphoribosyl)-5-[(5-phosphoribosylamino)methylideneamino]imidazole-4-carboxamide isomerase [Candidatus Dadabacteria bacterium]|nr:1-(5-phosphoribosyl)-5-[(5-phosphoribosylamino)methylideneamino]imidazole-4-carboxamide isomerase [Candidatus Dadabacteria bacterium]NIS07856.1 1-(5-phosphoribosyl)-5-[(5-phosphoribosylamino)methylideneamino]imidazole-4-carboxamide isomerase [Candidatus Dadabacteria bacterium]NIV42828.1 1-(5-phosphoribosyl)-5-[(5-phosphoribosylamino)methylideneamino]imidazole-4-carboxamide isomerase [Candidatus Dadabacteria bacterium]NIY21644.1 1-(5-phosphoribosyl)-5-[(5-phosphoribosylamino)methylideneamino]i
MQIIPAIDLKDGNCVRLLKGEEGSETIFSTSPVEQAKKWESCGAATLHLVDLDGAFTGSPKNREVIKKIVKAISCEVQLGGGIRELGTIDYYISSGVSRIILGTAAFKDPDLLKSACDKYPGRIAVGLDTKGGRIAIKGWKETIDDSTEQVLKDLENIGVSMIINTNVDRDGTLEGIDTDSVKEFLDSSPVPVIASGGISTDIDLENLNNLNSNNLYGAILGKSIYQGTIDLKKAIERFHNNAF